MNKKFELILHEVSRQFKSERSFYKDTLGITQHAWEKYKSGATNFNNVKLSIYNNMITHLFTPYESILINQAISAVDYNRYDNVIDAFHDIKLKYAKHILKNGGTIESEGAIYNTGQPTRKSIKKIRIVEEIGLNYTNIITFEVTIPKANPSEMHLIMPSGQRNKREWFDKYFNELVIK